MYLLSTHTVLFLLSIQVKPRVWMHPVKGLKVLLVDDDEEQLRSFRSILERNGATVGTSITGMEAVKMAQMGEYDVSIVDIKLPDIQGDEVVRRLKKIDYSMGFILVTGYPSLQDCIEVLDLGINDILLKPIEPEELLRAVAEAATIEVVA